MLVLGAAGNPWETLSSLQPLQPANASAPAAGIGANRFVTDGAASPDPNGFQPAAPPTGTIGQAASLSPDVLGFLIWNQSQQRGGAASASGATNPAALDGAGAPTTGAAGAMDPSGTASWPSFPSWFSPFNMDGSNTVGTFGTSSAAGSSTATSATTPTNELNTNRSILTAGQPGTTDEANGTHGHHHHHGGFAAQSQSSSSDPFANLFGTSAQDGSSATATNADGSTTTTITYADGSEVTLTTPAQASNSNASPTTAAAQPAPINSSNFLETLIQLQARFFAPTTAAV
jgi:hypothetical protein